MSDQQHMRFEANVMRRLGEIDTKLDEIKGAQRAMRAELVAIESLVQELVHDSEAAPVKDN
jgi:hypothetical protein